MIKKLKILNTKIINNKGSAVVMLLIGVAMFTIITSTAVTISYVNNQNIISVEQGDEALHAAESGAENALIKIIRSSTYSGESLTIDNTNVTITVATSVNQRTITSEATGSNYTRKVRVVGSFDSNGVFTTTSWKEID